MYPDATASPFPLGIPVFNGFSSWHSSDRSNFYFPQKTTVPNALSANHTVIEMSKKEIEMTVPPMSSKKIICIATTLTACLLIPGAILVSLNHQSKVPYSLIILAAVTAAIAIRACDIGGRKEQQVTYRGLNT